MMHHDDKIVMYGIPDIGKTYFAHKLKDHEYYCFEDMIDRHGIETLGLSTSANLKAIAKKCVGDKYVLDGWHLSDRDGLYLPQGCTVYVVFMEYARIVQHHPDMERAFRKWYSPLNLQRVRYWENIGSFIERSVEGYQAFLSRNKFSEN